MKYDYSFTSKKDSSGIVVDRATAIILTARAFDIRIQESRELIEKNFPNSASYAIPVSNLGEFIRGYYCNK